MNPNEISDHQIISGVRSISINVPKGDSEFLDWCVSAGIISAAMAEAFEDQVAEKETQLTVSFDTPGVEVIE